MAECVYNNECVRVTFDSARGVVHMGFLKPPVSDDVDHVWMIIETFVRNRPRKSILHMAHVDTPEMEPISAQCMLHLLTKVVSSSDWFASCCRKVIVQPRVVDDKVRFAHTIFKGLMANTSKIPLKIEADAAAVEALLEKYSVDTRDT